jgi:hypothetical protein
MIFYNIVSFRTKDNKIVFLSLIFLKATEKWKNCRFFKILKGENPRLLETPNGYIVFRAFHLP